MYSSDNGKNNDDQKKREQYGGEPRRGTPDPGPMKKK